MLYHNRNYLTFINIEIFDRIALSTLPTVMNLTNFVNSRFTINAIGVRIDN